MAENKTIYKLVQDALNSPVIENARRAIKEMLANSFRSKNHPYRGDITGSGMPRRKKKGSSH